MPLLAFVLLAALALDGKPRSRPNSLDEGRYRGSEPPGRYVPATQKALPF